jgi:hypothetical protein
MPDGGDHLGSSLAIEDGLLLAGAIQDDDGGNDAGAGSLFLRPPGGWSTMTESLKLLAPGAQAGDRFGVSIDIGGSTMVVGADANSSARSGYASVFEWDGAAL